MSTPEQPQILPIPATIDNASDWPAFAQQISAEAGLPTAVTPDLLAGMVASAVPLLYQADATRDVNPLRGTFADHVIAQLQRNLGDFEGAKPTSVAVHLVGAPMVDGQPNLRTHLEIQVQSATGQQKAVGQFWDLQLGAQAIVGQASCPNCGAPIASGHLLCEHCGRDVRSAVSVPLLVTRLELY